MKRKGDNKDEKRTLRQKFAERMEVSKEIVLDVPKIVLLGNGEAVIENHKGIAEYTTRRLVLEANPSAVKIIGENLEIKSVTGEMLFVTGRISGITFEGGVGDC